MISTEKQEEIQHAAEAFFETAPDWITFFREILGPDGLIRRRFPTRRALDEFEQTDAHLSIQHMLAKLRKRGPLPPNEDEPTRVITVRLPRSLHEALRDEAYEHRTSMNKLCISKLLRFIDSQMVPAETKAEHSQP